MTSREEHNRMRWASRRGLLELDLLLGPFVEAEFPRLDPSSRDDYRELMARDDHVLPPLQPLESKQVLRSRAVDAA